MQKMLKQLSDLVSHSRTWTAKVYDTLASPYATMPSTITEDVDYYNMIVDRLKCFKEEGLEELPLVIAEKKIQGLNVILDNFNQWYMKASTIIKVIEKASSSNKVERESMGSIHQVKCLVEEAQYHPCLKALKEYELLSNKLNDSKPLCMKLRHCLLPFKLRTENFKKFSWSQVFRELSLFLFVFFLVVCSHTV